jgi:hypothetical protein
MQPASLTVEAFVKVRRQMPHHVLLVSKRRLGQSGASWSLSIDPGGFLRVRLDTQTDAEGSDSPGFNQSVGSAAGFGDGEWHHVALTFWDGTEIPSNASEIGLADVTARNGRFETPVWIDLITGNVYEISAEQVVREGDVVTFKEMPFYDGPGAFSDRSLLSFEPARKKKEKAKKSPEKAGPRMSVFLLPGTQQPAPGVVIVGAADESSAEIAKWLNGQDAHAFVAEAGQDMRALLRQVRSRATEWQVKADAIGLMAVGREAKTAAIEAAAEADFTPLIVIKEGETFEPLPEPIPDELFVGEMDSWKESLAAFLEKRKGKVF